MDSSIFCNRLEMAGSAARFVYGMTYNLQAVHKEARMVVSLETLERYQRISCGRAASIVLQLAGVLPVGKTISHTKPDGERGKTKNMPESAISGLENLIPGTYKIVRAGKRFCELNDHHKQAGMVYIQDSNVCVSAGDGTIFSCNQAGKRYGEGGAPVLRISGYPFSSKILYIICPI